jgi:hypothetical protein
MVTGKGPGEKHMNDFQQFKKSAIERLNETSKELRELASKYILEGGRVLTREKQPEKPKVKDTFRFVNENSEKETESYSEKIAEVFSEKWPGRDISSPKYILGFNPTCIEGRRPNEMGVKVVNLTKQPQLGFQPEYLLIPSYVANSFMIEDLKIGRNSQFIAACEVPAIMFSENFPITRMKMDPCPVSTPITLCLYNTCTERRLFEAIIVGAPIDADPDNITNVGDLRYYWKFSRNPSTLTIYPVIGDVVSHEIKIPQNVFDMTEHGRMMFIWECIKKHFPVIENKECAS